MSGLLLCLLSFLTCALGGMVNWRVSFCILLVWGYFFGILKAHFYASSGHFIFDTATIGFYSSFLVNPPTRDDWNKSKKLNKWVVALIAWPVFVAIIPLQHYLVQMVGLRGNIFWLPMLIIGCWVDRLAFQMISITLASLNIVAFVFALAEFFLGVELFVPENEVTKIVYMSQDVAGGSFRIPATFTHAHNYAGVMLNTLPWLLGGLVVRGTSKWAFPLLVGGFITALMGIFIAGPKLPVLLLGLMVAFYLAQGRVNLGVVVLMILAASVVGYFVAQDERFQRFLELGDLEKVESRVGVSFNRDFLDILVDYPMGNGMGSGGTSLPYWIADMLVDPLLMENEYSRILIEQGLPGLVLFLLFLLYVFSFRLDRRDPLFTAKQLMWFKNSLSWVTAFIGIGMMTGVPSTTLLLVSMGFCLREFKLTPSRGRVSGMDLLGNVRQSAYQKGLAQFSK